LLIGKSEFHKGDFLGSIGTFSYITRHYATDKDVVAQAQLWMVRAYTEMDWLYEAEQILQQVNPDDLKSAHASTLASANAVLLLKRDQYREAIPYIEMLISKEKNKALKQRFSYVLAQLYEITENTKSAVNAYSEVIKMNPPYIMDFNARINRAQLASGEDIEKVMKDLRKMVKNSNNEEYLDQIYYAIGNIYLQNRDTVRAIENYNLSVENSTRNGIDKAVTLIKLGDLYYGDRKYVNAQPPFGEASKIITNEFDDYPRVSRLAEVLDELAAYYRVVTWQDTLQYLGTLAEEERLAFVNQIIERKIEEEKREEERQQKLAQAQQNKAARFVPTGGPLGTNAGKWYFYNPNLVKTGKTEFQKKWGNRRLEDNWRRTNKASSLFGDDSWGTADNDLSQDSTLQAASNSTATALVNDDKTPEYYLQQIPFTQEQLSQSNAQIADALFNMGMVYKDKLDEPLLAIETYQEFIKRFWGDNRVPDAYFQLYLIETKQGNVLAADAYRMELINKYPETRYAQVLSQPGYVERFLLMQKEQDSLYNATYVAYSHNDFQTVKMNVEYAKNNFPGSTLMPKFMFLNSLSVGKTDTPENFEVALNELVETYPSSDVSAMAKDMLALLRQGREAQVGTSHGTLLVKREEELKEELQADMAGAQTGFSDIKQGKHRLLLISSAEQQQMYQLMYQVAAFNFTRFMIKEFDLVLSTLDSKYVLSVTNFESYDEVLWYVNSINSDITLKKMTSDLNIQEVAISENNFDLIPLLSLDEYLVFRDEHLGSSTSLSLADIQIDIEENTASPTPVNAPVVAPAPIATPAPVQNNTQGQQQQGNSSAAVANPPVQTQNSVQSAQPVAGNDINNATVLPTEKAKEENVELYQGLFAYQPENEHVVAVYVLSGKFNFDKFKNDVDAYNTASYGMLNLTVSLEKSGTQSLITIGNFADANIAQSYLLRLVKEKTLFDGLKGSNSRNLLGTKRNLDVMMEKNAFKIYSTFMQEYYQK
ncbi:tetratricopeptide repeat protein, partial [Paludibacteraceae bacterium OttesenSCG-928-F17]|nr:tetratricopeptide repeat protein [Paludibacteraceae bacterium OttesenSCG-928-F17]